MITDFWKMGMESQSARDAKMRDRVAITTIYAARLVDDFNNPSLLRFGTPYPGPVRVEQGPMRTLASADMKHCAAGLRSSWEAAHYYMDETIKRRDELLAKYANERDSVAVAASSANEETPQS